MNNPLQIIAAVTIATSLSSCKDEEIRTVAYFSANPDARAEQLAACESRDNSDAAANCRNALEAERLAARERDKKAFESTFGKPTFN